MVKIYTKPGCIHCLHTKQMMDRLDIPYTEVDVTLDDAAKKYIKDELGYKVVPVVVHKDETWAGFQPERIKGIV